MRESVREVLPLMQNLVGEAFTVTLETRADSALADIDLQLVTQALSNLVMNSRESYEDGSGEISISVGIEEIDQLVAHLHPGTRPGRFVRVRVSDEGVGMSGEVLAHAVDPLFSTKRDRGHTGLGLSTVFAIMREHDGFMTIESHPTRGSDVVLYFPVSSGVPQMASETAAPQEPLAHAPSPVHCSVLVIEGRDELRTLLIEMVELLGYHASPCRDQAEALDFVRAHHVDIVVLDETLPRIGGQALMKQLRQERSEIKGVVLATSTHATVDASDSVVTKPFDITQLALALRAVDTGTTRPENTTSSLL
jgi:CheY-like chemotaxis protein